MSRSSVRIPEWAKSAVLWALKSIGFWAFTAAVGAGFTVYMDTDRNKRDIEVINKTIEHVVADVTEIRTDLRATRDSNDEKNRKGLEKLDQLIAMLERRRK
jgi:hypothetical protein